MRFAKGHGTENDFVILVDPDGEQGLPPGLAARLCDRRAGIGADGVLRAVRTTALAGGAGISGTETNAGEIGEIGGTGGTGSNSAVAGNGSGSGPRAAPEWFMDYRNSDGSPAEMCGNGLRVFARYLAGRGLATGPAFTVATRCGPRQVSLHDDGSVTAEMGGVTVLGPGRAVVGGVTCDGLRVSVGNPHLACLVDAPLARFDLTGPPQLDPAQFPQGGNVELVRVTGPGQAQMRVYERHWRGSGGRRRRDRRRPGPRPLADISTRRAAHRDAGPRRRLADRPRRDRRRRRPHRRLAGRHHRPQRPIPLTVRPNRDQSACSAAPIESAFLLPIRCGRPLQATP